MSLWPGHMAAVISTLEVPYAKAHEDASGHGPHAGFAAEVLHLTRLDCIGEKRSSGSQFLPEIATFRAEQTLQRGVDLVSNVR